MIVDVNGKSCKQKLKFEFNVKVPRMTLAFSVRHETGVKEKRILFNCLLFLNLIWFSVVVQSRKNQFYLDFWCFITSQWLQMTPYLMKTLDMVNLNGFLLETNCNRTLSPQIPVIYNFLDFRGQIPIMQKHQ